MPRKKEQAPVDAAERERRAEEAGEGGTPPGAGHVRELPDRPTARGGRDGETMEPITDKDAQPDE